MDRARALGGYKRLLRASRQLFAGDTAVLASSRVELRGQFVANRGETRPDVIEQLLKDIDEVEEMMLNNLVQGRINARGNVEVSMKKAPAQPAGSSCPPKFEPVPVDTREVARLEEELAKQPRPA